MPTTQITPINDNDRDGEEQVYYRTTVPASIVEIFEFNGKPVDWAVTSRGTVELRTAGEKQPSGQ